MNSRRKSLPQLDDTMSKKIVQLTKVIYHLNSQIEEHNNELQLVRNQYEKEIQQV